MGSDAVRRISNWDAKYKSDRIKAVIDDKREAMLSRVTAVTPALVDAEARIRQTLNAEGVDTIQFPFYLAFGREMWSLVDRGFAGDAAAQAAAQYVAKWVSHGLTQSVLEAIRTAVFNVARPTTP
jgi:cytosine/adenosine deaminase-related metal-dependent hydrolase